MKDYSYSLTGKRVWVAGHKGMVGSAIVRRLQNEDCEVICVERDEVNLVDAAAVDKWLKKSNIDVIFVAAAKVGGIHANNSLPADFIYNNLMIASNCIHAAYKHKVEKLFFMGSSCIYPRMAPQPMREDCLLTGPLEPTNEWYAIAKIAGIKLCQAYRQQHGCDFISAMPTNLYGPNDNFHPENSHVPAALLRRFHEAKMVAQNEVTVWGSGQPLREFLHVDDLADASVHLVKNYSGHDHVNVGCGKEISIAGFAEMVKETVGFEGGVVFDTSRPDGMPLKRLDVSKMTALGWNAQISLCDGLRQYYDWYLENIDSIRV
jgi:GDP-L-fucose synthase